MQAVQNFKNAARYDLKTVRIAAEDGKKNSVAGAALGIMKRMMEFYRELDVSADDVLEFEYRKFTEPENRYAWQIRKKFRENYVQKGLELAKERQGE